MGPSHEAQANGIGAFVNRTASRVVSAVSRKLALAEESRLPAAVASQFVKSPLTATLPEAGYIAFDGGAISYVVSGGNTLIKDVPLAEAYRIGGPLAKQLAKNPGKPMDLYVDSDLALRPELNLNGLPANVKVINVTKEGALMGTKLFYRQGKPVRFVEWSESLLIEEGKGFASGTFKQLMERTFSINDVRLLGLVDRRADRVTVEALEAVAKHHGVSHRIGTPQQLAAQFKAAKGKLLLVAGHVENGAFVIRNEANDVLFRVPQQELTLLAQRHKVTLFQLGCKTGPGGFPVEINSIDLAVQLNRAFRADNYGAFFQNLGTPDAPFLCTSEQAAAGLQLALRRENAIIKGSAIESVGVTNIAPRVQDFAETLLDWLSWAAQGTLGVLATGGIFSLLFTSLKPLRWAVLLLYGIVASPYLLLGFLLKRRRPKTLGEKVLEARVATQDGF